MDSIEIVKLAQMSLLELTMSMMAKNTKTIHITVNVH